MLFSTTSGKVTCSPSPQTEHGGKPGDGGMGAPTVTGEDDIVTGAMVSAPAGTQPQGPAKPGRIGQNCSSTKPSWPARWKAMHETGSLPGMSSNTTSGSEITRPSPQIEHGGKPGEGGVGWPASAGAADTGAGVIGAAATGAAVAGMTGALV